MDAERLQILVLLPDDLSKHGAVQGELRGEVAVDQGFGNLRLAGDLKRLRPVITAERKDAACRVQDLGSPFGTRHAFSGHEHSLTFISSSVNLDSLAFMGVSRALSSVRPA
jgi:hypothetical protein